MFCGAEAVGQNLRQGEAVIAIVGRSHVDHKIIVAKFPHHLPAHAAGRERAGDHAVLAAAHGNGHKIPVSIVDRLEKGCALGADSGGKGGVFNVAALVNRAVGAQQRRAHLVAGVRDIRMGHGLFRHFDEFFRCHR